MTLANREVELFEAHSAAREMPVRRSDLLFKMANKTRLMTMPLIVIALVVLTGCKDEANWKQNKFKKHELLQSNSDPQMPEVLWQRIEALYTGLEVPEEKPEEKPANKSKAKSDGEAEATKDSTSNAGADAKPEPKSKADHTAAKETRSSGETARAAPAAEGGEGASGPGASKGTELEKGVLPTEFAPLRVYLVEKNRGVLHGINYEIVFGPGGGELDLQDFVENRKGSFYFAVEFMPDVPIEKGSLNRKIFFLSNSLRRHNQSETIGNGCHNYYDITTSFEAAMKGNGYPLNTTDLRHVSALAGTFFFALKNEGKLSIAQLTIKDSSHRGLQCRR